MEEREKLAGAGATDAGGARVGAGTEAGDAAELAGLAAEDAKELAGPDAAGAREPAGSDVAGAMEPAGPDATAAMGHAGPDAAGVRELAGPDALDAAGTREPTGPDAAEEFTPDLSLYHEPDYDGLSEAIEAVDLGSVGRTAEKVALAAVVATSLSAALSEPPRADLMTLPEPTPIVRLVDPELEASLDAQEDQVDESASRRKRLLRLLRMLAVAVLLAASVLFGALKGCAGLLAAPLLPHDEEQQEQTTHQTQTEDERGVAVAG